MLNIEYCPEGIATPDSEAENLVRRLAVSPIDVNWQTSTENVVMAARVLLSEGVIPFGGLKLSFKGEDLPFDRNGRLAHWPRDYCPYMDSWLERILVCTLDKKESK